MIRCTKCGELINPQEGQAENEWIEIIRLLPVFGKHSRLAFEYVELFSVTPLRMKGKKILRLLTGLAKLFDSEEYVFNRKKYKISRTGIVEALTIVCNKHFDRPLENNNYLIKVMIGISEREMKEQRDLADRRQREREKAGRKPEEDGITAVEFKKQTGIESLTDKIGSKFKVQGSGL
ncbi:MAG: hypothetical protein JW882_09945 [Deltaproteobacteria bacterium]|nr:hypothetical protein [Deltaproteobacteria bacterium]